MLVEAASRDDAAVFQLSEERALIATIDFFTPIVDDAAQWGAIACANALSDVYAMGGTPLFALNVVGWPRETLPFELLGEVLAGAAEVAQEAGCLIVGGHTIDDPEPKFGLAVIGEVHPDRMMTNTHGSPGDQLVLTKPLGTGILTTALKRQRLSESDLDTAVKSMRKKPAAKKPAKKPATKKVAKAAKKTAKKTKRAATKTAKKARRVAKKAAKKAKKAVKRTVKKVRRSAKKTAKKAARAAKRTVKKTKKAAKKRATRARKAVKRTLKKAKRPTRKK